MFQFDITELLGNLSRISIQTPMSHEVSKVTLTITELNAVGAKSIVNIFQRSAKMVI